MCRSGVSYLVIGLFVVKVGVGGEKFKRETTKVVVELYHKLSYIHTFMRLYLRTHFLPLSSFKLIKKKRECGEWCELSRIT